MSTTLSTEPIVKLENHFKDAFDNVVATARTCYSSRVITSEDVHKDDKSRDLRDRIAESIYKAGHHTTIQHSTFQFILDKVSRQFIWSFLHSHPFYNSEQVSQRYVEVSAENFFTPPIEDAAASEIYLATIRLQMQAYKDLIRILDPAIRSQYARIFPNRDPELKKWASALKKRAQEVARYVLPVATHAHLYHTISGLTLHRYHRLMNQFDTPYEQRIVVKKMIAAVTEVDPLFFRNIEDSLPLDKTPEYEFFASREDGGLASREAFVAEFDGKLGSLTSRLVDYKINGQKSMAEAVRVVLGLTENQLSESAAIDLVLNPAKNHYFGEALNLTTLGKLSRTMVHPHFTFQKKISHTADSQDQRHRMTPASRPILHRHFRPSTPDYIIPALIQVSPEAMDYYAKTMQTIWKNMTELLNRGVQEEYVMYLLPNAFPIRFYESGDLLNHHHKWTKRLCYTAQEEIWNMCKDEVMQVGEVFPEIAKFMLPPCGIRNLAGTRPYCPEGERFCGVPVWKLPVKEFERVL
jgi:flavin-dependent thymidylate synthase